MQWFFAAHITFASFIWAFPHNHFQEEGRAANVVFFLNKLSDVTVHVEKQVKQQQSEKFASLSICFSDVS